MRYKLLSYPINERTPLYGSNPPISIEYPRSMDKGDPANTAMITMHNHTSTHVDAPKHFSKDGRSIWQYSIEELIFESPVVVTLSTISEKEGLLIKPSHFTNKDLDKMKSSDMLILNTGFHIVRSDEIYRIANPGISPKLAEMVRVDYPGIRCLMIDSLSISSRKYREEGREAHRILLGDGDYPGEPVLLAEDVNLGIDLEGLKKVFIVPLYVEGVDSMPCTIIGEY